MADMLRTQSKDKYIAEYKKYTDWRQTTLQKNNTTEDILLAYFNELNKSCKPSILWPIFSMLKSLILSEEGINIVSYIKLKALIKRFTINHKPKKSEMFNAEEIYKFLSNADDKKHLLNKTVLAVGISGACRRDELYKLSIDRVKDIGNNVYLVSLTDMKTKRDKSFTISGIFYEYCKKYIKLRPEQCVQKNFFINYQNGKCTRQSVGINKLGAVPKVIAKYLNLDKPEDYTGHCFRRTSALVLMGSEGGLITLNPRRGLRSSSVAESGTIANEKTNESTHDDSDSKVISTPYRVPFFELQDVKEEVSMASSENEFYSEDSLEEPEPTVNQIIPKCNDVPIFEFQNCDSSQININETENMEEDVSDEDEHDSDEYDSQAKFAQQINNINKEKNINVQIVQPGPSDNENNPRQGGFPMFQFKNCNVTINVHKS